MLYYTLTHLPFYFSLCFQFFDYFINRQCVVWMSAKTQTTNSLTFRESRLPPSIIHDWRQSWLGIWIWKYKTEHFENNTDGKLMEFDIQTLSFKWGLIKVMGFLGCHTFILKCAKGAALCLAEVQKAHRKQAVCMMLFQTHLSDICPFVLKHHCYNFISPWAGHISHARVSKQKHEWVNWPWNPTKTTFFDTQNT